MLGRLSPLAAGFVMTAIDSPRAIPTAVLTDKAATMGAPALQADTVEDALDMARAETGPDGAVLVCGSLYLVGEIKDLLG
jgi:dihydrofolate synthase/folylpolyglutamate synthase